MALNPYRPYGRSLGLGAFASAPRFRRNLGRVANQIINRDRARARAGRSSMTRLASKLGVSKYPNKRRRIGPAVSAPAPLYRVLPGAKMVGRFRKLRRLTKKVPFAASGYQRESEVYGTYTCPEVAHIGIQSARIREVGIMSGVALIRYIMNREFKKQYRDDSEILSDGVNPATSGDFPLNIVIVCEANRDTGRTTSNVTYTVSSTTTVLNFGEWFSDNVFNLAVGGGEDNSTSTWSRVTGYYFVSFDNIDAIPGSTSRTSGVRDIRDLRIQLYSHATLKLQNTTAGNAGGLEMTDIGANPLEGRMFRLKGMLPTFNQGFSGSNYANTFSNIQNNGRIGVLLPAAAPVGNAAGVPNPRDFEYCRYTSKVSINPGEIKHYSISFRFTGLLNDLIAGFAQSATTAPFMPRSAVNKFGKFGQVLLISLEKAVRTGPAAVAVGYHAEWKTGAKVIGLRPVIMTKSNVAAVESTVTVT